MASIGQLKSETIVDRLGELKARISDLTTEEKILVDELKARGFAEIDGEVFRATVFAQLSERLDTKAARAFLEEAGVLGRFLTSSTSTVCKVVARIRAKAA